MAVTGRATAVVAAVGGLAALGYIDWVVAPAVVGRANPDRGYISELGARTQPHHALFNGLQILDGLLVVALAVALLRLAGRTAGRWATLGYTCLAVFGVGGIADALLPMDCAPSRSAACARAPAAGRVSWVDHAHGIESVVTTTALFVAMGALALAVARAGRHRLAAVSASISVAVCANTLYEGVAIMHGHLIGRHERADTVLTALWLVGVAVLPLVTARRGSALVELVEPGVPLTHDVLLDLPGRGLGQLVHDDDRLGHFVPVQPLLQSSQQLGLGDRRPGLGHHHGGDCLAPPRVG
jgi:hypothetical protein